MGICMYDRRGNFIGVKLQNGACTQEDEAATTHHAETITAAPPAAVSEPAGVDGPNFLAAEPAEDFSDFFASVRAGRRSCVWNCHFHLPIA
jgi:hypothetical protein